MSARRWTFEEGEVNQSNKRQLLLDLKTQIQTFTPMVGIRESAQKIVSY